MGTDTLDGVPLLSEVKYSDLRVGQRFGPFREPLAANVSDGLRGPVGEPRPGSCAPGGVLPLLTLRALRRALDGIPPGGILLNQRFAVHAELPAAGDVDIAVRVSAQTEHRGNLDTRFTFRLEGAGDLVAVVDWTIRAA